MIKKYTIKGLVQGIGYRPFVAKTADELNIDGWVRNTGGIVTVLASGDEISLRKFQNTIVKQVPTGGFISDIEVEELSSLIEIEKCEKFDKYELSEGLKRLVNNIMREQIEKSKTNNSEHNEFMIIESDDDIAENLPLIPADIATCPECERELLDPNNRRYRHPFISCTICGPRYSILEKLPYDRDTITMDDFDMCPDCQREYTGKTNRRRHAQTIACNECGPKLEFMLFNRHEIESVRDNNLALTQAVRIIKTGGILAIKDIGGYHLACNPFDYKVVEALRRLKHREEKAFAVMFGNTEQVTQYCEVNQQEQELLESPARPIVLLKKKAEQTSASLAHNVCLTSPSIGAMLPCNPTQILLIKECGPLIMTSGNASGDVLEIDNENMKRWLQNRVESGILGDVEVAMLSHDRRILRPMDDSVMKVVRGRQQFIRRGRGYVPNPIPVSIDGEIFAAGGDLKSSFCFVKNGLAYVSQYLGDLESVSCQKFYTQEKEAMARIFGFKPKTVVTDKHPGYFSSRIEKEKEIQHHKAHVASVIAEHNLSGPVLGFAFDGTGYGDDGTIWGSETFLWDGKSKMERVAHLKPMKLIGGDEGAKNCDTILAAMLYGSEISFEKEQNTTSAIIESALENNINTVTSTSMGRLFDAVAALLDICHYNSYEGQAPVELENIASLTEHSIPLYIPEDGDIKVLFQDIVNAIIGSNEELNEGLKAKLARSFIYAVSDYVYTIVSKNNVKQIVLSGGTFLNRILLERTIDNLEKNGYNVYIANQLPPGDGGICLGQAYLASRTINN